jgi:hypothetical protein
MAVVVINKRPKKSRSAKKPTLAKKAKSRNRAAKDDFGNRMPQIEVAHRGRIPVSAFRQAWFASPAGIAPRPIN